MTDLGDFKRDVLPGLVRQAETRGYLRAMAIAEAVPTTTRDRTYRRRVLEALAEGRKP